MAVWLLASFKPAHDPGDARSSRSSFVSPVFRELPLGDIQPQGWLLHQLQIMRDGTTSHLDEVYNRMSEDNGWLGGAGDGGEETPYWLDGAVPLAYMLRDASLIKKVKQYIDWTLDHQRPSGYFGPYTNWEMRTGKKVDVANSVYGDDWWPRMVMLKVLQQYYLATHDKRVVPFMTRYFHYQLNALGKTPLSFCSEWASSRGSDNVMMVQWLYGITSDTSLLSLAAVIEKQAYPWGRWFGDDRWIIHTTNYRNTDTLMNRHAVNVAMGLKAPAISYQRTGDKQELFNLKKGYYNLMMVHGLPMGSFSGDEDLNGNDPSQGSELCSIVESMFSLEKIIELTGDASYADPLERLAFNALPPQTSDDYNHKQYFQVANQVQISKGVFDFSLPFERQMCNVLGMRSGYTCCLANMHQGWTKFASHLWYSTATGGLAALTYSPSTLTARLGRDSVPVTIQEVTDYPFSSDISFRLKMDSAVVFPLQLRVPAWCNEATVLLNGKPLQTGKAGSLLTLYRAWQPGDELLLQLPMEIQTSIWGRNSRTVERGPLVYALKLNEKWKKGHDKREGDYYSVYPANDWNYGLLEDAVEKPGEEMRVESGAPVNAAFVWNLDHAPLQIKVPARTIPGWKAVNGVSEQPVNDRTGVYRGKVSNKTEDVTLVPYGCTKVRVVAFPVVAAAKR
ncbi:hypothetical protein DXN05_14120 [Deminuibacter soli]|uniref:Transcriptional initiation protein Tat n=2 Tax=Deminuibacter soli TaxID=2291815 RepID=A0A3E1NJA2_9BACT|nr:hypothetical protein DXN05_14120 [Deminuibacter soli]